MARAKKFKGDMYEDPQDPSKEKIKDMKKRVQQSTDKQKRQALVEALDELEWFKADLKSTNQHREFLKGAVKKWRGRLKQIKEGRYPKKGINGWKWEK